MDVGSGWAHREIHRKWWQEKYPRKQSWGQLCPHRQLGIHPVIWSSLTSFWRQAEEQQWPEITHICLTLPVLVRLSASKTPACKLFQAVAGWKYSSGDKVSPVPWFKILSKKRPREIALNSTNGLKTRSICRWAIYKAQEVQASHNLGGPHPLASLSIHGPDPLTPSTGSSGTHALSMENAPTSSPSLKFPFALWVCHTTEKVTVHTLPCVNGASEGGQRP